MKIDRILMPTDFSECSNRALDHALFLAEQFGAELHFLHVVTLHSENPAEPDRDFPDNDTLFQHLREISTTEMKGLIDGRNPLQIHEHIRRGIAAAPEIIALAEERDIDVIVMGAHGRRGLRRLLLGSVTEETVRTATCPVLTLREDGPKELRRPERILVPVDFSEPAKEAMRTAMALAATYGGRLEIVHVVEQPIYPQAYEGFYTWVPTGTFLEMRSGLEEHLTTFVDAICCGGPAPYSITLREGNPAQEICEYIQSEKPDLTVIATHGLTGLEHLMLGSVAERVVRQSEGPVLTVKAPPSDEDATGEAIDIKAQAAA